MNCRIQVEHPVTEMTTGTDLVAWQIELARGNLSPFDQSRIVASGHAIECRLYAENPAKHFMPSPGRLVRFRMPEPSADVRVDSGFREDDAVTFRYDPMLAKIIVRCDDRDAAIDRMRKVLDTVEVDGIATNAAYLAACMEHPAFRAGDVATDFIVGIARRCWRPGDWARGRRIVSTRAGILRPPHGRLRSVRALAQIGSHRRHRRR